MMTTTSPLEVIQQVFEAESAEAARDLFHEDVVASSWEMPGVEFTGFSAINEEFFLPSEAAFTDVEFDMQHMAEAGSLVVVDAIFRGVFSADYHGIPAHGKAFAWAMRDIFQVEQGTISHMWFGSDTLEVARQLGVIDQSTRLFPED